jgi:hypothetical protein
MALAEKDRITDEVSTAMAAARLVEGGKGLLPEMMRRGYHQGRRCIYRRHRRQTARLDPDKLTHALAIAAATRAGRWSCDQSGGEVKRMQQDGSQWLAL